MHNPDEDHRIVRRLQSPPERTVRPQKAAALVRRYYELIRQLREQGGGAGKTWEEIGRDLRPANPIAAGTVAQAYGRIRRAHLKRQGSDRTLTGSGHLPSTLENAARRSR